MKRLVLMSIALGFLSITCKETETVYTPVNTLTDPGLAPTVIYTFPSQGSSGPYDGFATTITVRFNKLMDAASLHHAIHFTSTAGDLESDTSLLSLNQGDVASISPIRPSSVFPFLWKIGKSYRLRIDSTAKDLNGHRLMPSFILDFTPEPRFRVRSISPAPGSENFTGSALQLAFNAKVDTSILRRITISPPVSGLWHFQTLGGGQLDSSQLILQSANGFAAGQSYTVSIGSDAVDKNGNHLTGGYSSSFATTPFLVLSTSPANGSTGWNPSSRSIVINFSDTIDTSTVASAFNITPPTRGQLAYSSTFKTVRFIASDLLLPDTVYTVTIDTSIRSKTQGRLPQPFEFSFMTGQGTSGSEFYVLYTYPANGDTSALPGNEIQIEFSAPLDTSTVRGAISISPPVPGLLGGYDPYVVTFSPIRNFATSTTYTVTVAPTVRSKDGVSLGSAYNFSFRTVPFGILRSYPPNGATHIPTTSSLDFQASDLIDTSTVWGSFNISPAVNGSIYIYSSQDEFYFYPTAPMQPYTIYTVTISTALRSSSGETPPRPFVMAFSTGAN